jgi:hypothetical protein
MTIRNTVLRVGDSELALMTTTVVGDGGLAAGCAGKEYECAPELSATTPSKNARVIGMSLS